MTDKKFTDKEIIKAIGNLFKNTDGIYELTIQKSTKGVYGEKQYCCIPEGVYNLIMQQSSFIDRQKSEIERLKGSTIVNNIMESQRIKREAKAEAYKEFAEELKNILRNIPKWNVKKWNVKKLNFNNVGFSYDDVFFSIDNLLKEMVGEEE